MNVNAVLDYEDVPDFRRRVYDIARRIAPGSTRSYREVAAAAKPRMLMIEGARPPSDTAPLF